MPPTSIQAGFYVRGLLALLTVGFALLAVPAASAQSLVEMYRSARFRAHSHEVLERHGYRAVPLPPTPLPYVSDSVRRQIELFFPPPQPEVVPEAEPPIRLAKLNLIPKLGSRWFEEEFAGTRWSYLGSNRVVSYDTTFTRELRARLEARHGAPTRTLAERFDGSDEYIQFEYWFVVNDTIPLIIMDTNGPFERGVVVATDQSYRALLPDLKDAFLRPVMEDVSRAPYADYYYLAEQNAWFVTGFDGERYVLNRIARPNLRLGRPLLSTLRGR